MIEKAQWPMKPSIHPEPQCANNVDLRKSSDQCLERYMLARFFA
jgi:hypothetical protein